MLRKVLVANRGEIACRILRTCRRLGVPSVAVYSDADADAMHAQMADEAERIGPPPVRESYLDMGALLEAARRTKASAIHPGYGLLSESADFARRVQAAGLVYVGPRPDVLETLGDKTRACQLARECGVPTVPGTQKGFVPNRSESMDALRAIAEASGYPTIVKAVAGGGGIGMQIIRSAEDWDRCVRICSERALAAFGDAQVFVEKYLERPKHIEMQVMADEHGEVVVLGERECSLQRRHQKIIEESPSPAPWLAGETGRSTRDAMAKAAVRIATQVGYVGAGTVEFVSLGAGQWYFLEVNARLQVEHPVTEMCTGLDLVEWQLRVADGEPLTPELRQIAPQGHAIEARIYAEDPAKGFAPQPGELRRLVWPDPAPELRVETGVREGDRVTPYYDPLLAKLVVHAADRRAAIDRLESALASTTVDLWGPKRQGTTNLALLRKCLSSSEFLSGTYHTQLGEELAIAHQ